MNSVIPKLVRTLFPFLMLASCSPAKQTETVTKSPDGRYSASVQITDRGAVSKPTAKIVLHDEKNRIGEKDIVLFEGRGAWPVQVHWAEPSTMVIEFCDGDDFEVRSGIFENKIVEMTGKRSRFTTHVVTTKKEAYAGMQFCK